MAKKQSNIDDFKDRMNSPVVAVRVNPKTGKPIKRSGGKSPKKK